MQKNPVLKREVRANMRSPKLILSIIGFNLVLALSGFIFLAFFEEAQPLERLFLELFFQEKASSMTANELAYNSIRLLYCLLILLEFVLLFFIIPTLTGSMIAGEREHQTLDLMLTTQLTPKTIVFGKLLAMMKTILMILISTLPILSLVNVFGSFSVLDMLASFGVMLVVSFFLGSVGLLFSAWIKRSVPATLCTYIVLVGLCVLPLILVRLMPELTGSSGGRPATFAYSLAMLMNPLLTIVCLLKMRFGAEASFVSYLESTTHLAADSPIVKHWLIMSLLLQVTIAYLLVLLSTKYLQPRYRRREMNGAIKEKMSTESETADEKESS